MRKANFAENKVSFVRGGVIWTTDVFTANNQAVMNTVKWQYGAGLLWKSMSLGSRNAPNRRLVIKEVSEQVGSDPTLSTRHTHLGNHHHWQRPSCNWTDLQQWCQFQEPFWLLMAVELIMVTMSSRLNLNFLKIYSPTNVSIKWTGSVPKNLVPAQHSHQLNMYKTEQP